MGMKKCKYCRHEVKKPCSLETRMGCSLFSQSYIKSRSSKKEVFTTTDEGTKFDEGKLPIDLLAPEFLYGTAAVLAFGAEKYEAYNWAKGMKWSRVFAALMRHMWKWWGGEKLDQETGLSHLWHAACCLMFLMAYEMRGTGTDDRPT